MPRQNRVDPFGRIFAHPARGMLMGNRGCLHDDAGNIVRQSANDAWISCMPRWSGVRRQLMRPGHYTELFFLDEATALAAGHRPCGSCRPQALVAFKIAWQRVFGLAHLPQVAEIDRTLRVVQRGDPHHNFRTLPNGAIVAVDGVALLRWRGRWLSWTPNGYRLSAVADRSSPECLTPRPVLALLHAGYSPIVDQSAIAFSGNTPHTPGHLDANSSGDGGCTG